MSEMPSHSVISVTKALQNIKEFFGSKFSEVFKIITADNGCEFADLSDFEKKTKLKQKCISLIHILHLKKVQMNVIMA